MFFFLNIVCFCRRLVIVMKRQRHSLQNTLMTMRRIRPTRHRSRSPAPKVKGLINTKILIHFIKQSTIMQSVNHRDDRRRDAKSRRKQRRPNRRRRRRPSHRRPAPPRNRRASRHRRKRRARRRPPRAWSPKALRNRNLPCPRACQSSYLY
jgi:hypothetical protein